MIVTVDIGNAYVTIGCVKKHRDLSEGTFGDSPYKTNDTEKTDDSILFLSRINTETGKTAFEYASDLYYAFRLHKIPLEAVTGGIISSVVPKLLPVLEDSIRRVFSFDPVIVSSKCAGIPRISIDRPEELGSNLIVDAAAAVKTCCPPIILIDMGLATSIGVIDKDGTYIGGAILPGLQASVNELTKTASSLSGISIEGPVSDMPKNTRDALVSGVLLGNAGMIDGMIDRIEDTLGAKASILSTGRLSKITTPFCRHKITVDESLPIRGLAAIYEAEKGAL